MEIILKNIDDLEIFASAMAAHLNAGDRILLCGDLGAGKTTFVSAVMRALGSKDAVSSPSFTLIQRYQAFCQVYHMDLYRLRNSQELDHLDVLNYLTDKQAIVFVEWATKLGEFCPKTYLKVEFDFPNPAVAAVTDQVRQVHLTAKGKHYQSLAEHTLETAALK